MLRFSITVFFLVNAVLGIGLAAGDTPLQVHYATHLKDGDAMINITNTGAGTTAFSLTTPSVGNLCANVYAFSVDERLVSCCSCLVTPNALVSLSARNDLVSNTLTGQLEDSIVVKVLATNPGGGFCNAATAGISTSLATGLLAWGTTLHTAPAGSATKYHMTETPFSPARLAAGELTRFTQMCAFMQVNGGGQGLCYTCRLGAYGAVGVE